MTHAIFVFFFYKFVLSMKDKNKSVLEGKVFKSVRSNIINNSLVNREVKREK